MPNYAAAMAKHQFACLLMALAGWAYTGIALSAACVGLFFFMFLDALIDAAREADEQREMDFYDTTPGEIEWALAGAKG